MFIYGNWSAYDELSDSVKLDEGLAMRQMDHLLRLKSRGVRFDAYLMDAFWYDPSGAYRVWRKESWPAGPGRWLQHCFDNDLLPGLWFTANTLFHMELPDKWADSIDSKSWGLCCFEGGFLDDFIEILTDWYRQGVRIFKLDFAEFGAVPTRLERTIDPAEARERNISAYRAGLARFKAACPEAVVMGFNGFDERDCMDRSDNPPGRYIDPDWLTVLDSVYCGDPRPSDIPMEFWRSVDVYSDCMTRLFESSGIPLSRIDNCGFMAGPTGTCYWRGKEGWQAMLVLSLARGGKIHVAYGDLSLFTDEDAEWWAKIQGVFSPYLERGTTVSVGSWPGKNSLVYGWRSELDGRTITTTVQQNHCLCTVQLTLSTPWEQESDPERLEVMPSETASTGKAAVGPPSLGYLSEEELDNIKLRYGSQPIPQPEITKDGISLVAQVERLLDEPEIPWRIPVSLAQIRQTDFGTNKASLVDQLSGTFTVTLTQTDDDGRAVRTVPNPDFPFKIEIEDEAGWRSLPAMFERPIWSGISWSLNRFEACGLKAIRATTSETQKVRLSLELFLDK